MSVAAETTALERLAVLLNKLFFTANSPIPLTSLGCAALLGIGYLVWRRRSRGRAVSPGVIVRALFPRRMLTSPSMVADLWYLLFNTFVMGLLFGWAIVSMTWISNQVIGGLTGLFGAVEPTAPGWQTRVAITLVLFLAYELGYWLDHYLSHRFEFLWEFHKVHHSAEVLTPFTAFRVHPVESIKFANILALSIGLANGGVSYLWGVGAHEFTLSGGNLILVVFMHIFIHLQHSQLWIAIRGVPGHILLSPAHHQVHHSSNPAHFNRNFGSCLAVWDWMFSTLHIPSKEPEKLSFGVVANGRNDHSISGVFIAPFINAAKLARRRLWLRGPKRTRDRMPPAPVPAPPATT